MQLRHRLICWAAFSLGVGELTAQVSPTGPGVSSRPIRVAFVGDDATQGTPATAPAGGRGGVQIPGVSADQQAVLAAMTDGFAAKVQAATDARTALGAASVTIPMVATDVEAKAEALKAAELALALARADAFAKLQASPFKLSADQTPALAQQARGTGGAGGGAAGGGRGRGAPAAAAAVVPPPPTVASANYPGQAGAMLGARWDVRNFGVSGTTVLKRGDYPYSSQAAFEAALNFDPDVVVIMFGTSDSKAQNWKYASDFISDYKELIARFAALPSRPQIWISKPLPAFSSAYGVDDKVIAEQVVSRVAQIAAEANVRVIDLFSALQGRPELVPDGVHPNASGARVLAMTTTAALMGQPPALTAPLPAATAAGGDFKVEPGFVSLFNGTDLTGWGYTGATVGVPAESFDGKTASSDGRYSVKDGIITIEERVPRYMQGAYTQRQYSGDFVLRLEFRPAVGGDSGIFVRGVQLQCRDYLTMGPYYDLTKYKPQDWNELEITVKGQTAYGTCNGQVLEASMTIAALGNIGLEADIGSMQYRRIRIKETPAK